MGNPIQMPVVASELKNRHASRDMLNREVSGATCCGTVGEYEEALGRQHIARALGKIRTSNRVVLDPCPQLSKSEPRLLQSLGFQGVAINHCSANSGNDSHRFSTDFRIDKSDRMPLA